MRRVLEANREHLAESRRRAEEERAPSWDEQQRIVDHEQQHNKQ